MSRTIITFAATLVLASSNASAGVAELDWMTGCWAQDGRDTGSIEQWSSPAGGIMLGFSRTISDGKTVAFEYLRIVDEDDNVIVLIASPSGQETTRFEMIEIGEHKVIFENTAHDFPQRIIYRLNDDGNLLGRIEGTIGGAERAADFPMTRTLCDNAANATPTLRQPARQPPEFPLARLAGTSADRF